MARIVLLRAADDRAEDIELLGWRDVADESWQQPEARYEVDGTWYPVTSFAVRDDGIYVMLARHPSDC